MDDAGGFQVFDLNKQLLTAVAEAGYEQPTPIQAKTIPLVMAGHDVLGIAQTGTGKTAAYLLPLLMKLKYAQGQHPRAIILAPTRELVLQIAENVRLLAAHTDLRSVALYGGIGPKTQIEQVQEGCDLIISTPARVMELYLKEVLRFVAVKHLVLDEADKMMDMGFMPQIRRLLEVMPTKRQNLLFSATMPEKVVRLSEEFLEDPLRVEITPQATTAETVEQWVYETPNRQTKLNLIRLFLQDKQQFSRVIIFTKSKIDADAVLHSLEGKTSGQIRVVHGNKGQNSRINAMEAFRAGEVRVLIATDVAARGLDIPQVSHVINFDVPMIYEDYVHRIGRTGRAHNVGTAITFVQQADEWHLRKVEDIIRQKITRSPMPTGLDIPNTPYDENQEQLRELDRQRRRDDPEFKGAFHDKKGMEGKRSPKLVSSAKTAKAAAAKTAGKTGAPGGPGAKGGPGGKGGAKPGNRSNAPHGPKGGQRGPSRGGKRGR